MKKKKIEVTDEEMRQAGEKCRTFSDEYWRSMTRAQQEELVKVRESMVLDAAHRVLRNEEAAGIRDKMAELRSRKSGNDEAVRDLYFAIPEEAVRIEAINDLFHYESARKGHDTSMVLEAYYRLSDVQEQLSSWPGGPAFKKLVFITAALNVAVFAAQLIWPNIDADWFFGISVVWVLVWGLCSQVDLRRMESHYFLLWEIEKLRRGVQDSDLDPPRHRYELFSERERQSGRRSVPREIPW
jgi:hypothetical protein